MDGKQMSTFSFRRRPARFDLLEKRGRANILFVTVCLQERVPSLQYSVLHHALLEAWTAADAWLVGKYMIMPDHIHFFCAPGTGDPVLLRTWVRYWKRLSTQAAASHQLNLRWQRDCWDRQIRTGNGYTEKWDYVQRNPERAGLIEDSKDWPYRGELHLLRWREAD